MEMFFNAQKKALIVKLKTELDHHSAKNVRRMVDLYFADSKANHIIFDLSELEFMDSSGIGLVLGRLKELRAVDGRILIINPNPTMEKIFQCSGLTPFIFKGTEIEALHFAGGKIYG